MKIFVTGATGFIGRHFLEKLLVSLTSEDIVYVLCRSPYQPKDARVTPVSGDLLTIEYCRDLLLECDYVFHLAACAIFGNDLPYDDLNYVPTQKMIQILQESGNIKNFIFLSTIGALDRAPQDLCEAPLSVESHPSPTSRYGQSKLKAEESIRGQTKVPYTIIRATWVYGKYMRMNSHINVFVDLVSRKRWLKFFLFPGRVSLIHVDDLSKTLTHCIDNPRIIRKTYMAVTENLTLGDIFREIALAGEGKRFRQLRVPRFSFLLSKVHRFFPLTLSNLFLDYLCAEDAHFQSDFNISHPISFAEGKNDVIEDHVSRSGYWLITGANSGIGLSLARMLHRLGKRVILVDEEVDCIMDCFSLSDRCLVFEANLSSEKELFLLSSRLQSYRLFALINNAGLGYRGSIQDVSFEEITRIMDVNVKAPMFLTKSLLSNLIRNRSVIVNVSSSIAYNPLPYMSLYSSSKAALAHWSESLSYELRHTNRVITLYPSGTYTRFQERAGVRVLENGKGLLSADYVAGKIKEAVDRGSCVSILGWQTRILLAISKILPQKLNTMMWGRLFQNLR